MGDSTMLVGAVAYHSRIVPIWEDFNAYFAARGVPTDYVLFSNYERQVDALLAGAIDIAWNTNTAYVAAEHRIGGGAQILGMRNVDADYATVIATRRDEAFGDAFALAGRTLALGSRDSGHAAILPLHYLAEQGLVVDEAHLLRFDTDMGTHGDTGDSELHVLRAVASGEADAGAVGDAAFAALRAAGSAEVAELVVSWRSPTYYHCNFTALPSLDRARARAWSEALLAMSYDDPWMRQAMDLEGVRHWLPGDKAGYADLTVAMQRQGYLE
jgi:ABC-type phosphate/phosphonate transport system substrate-binding protein